MYASSIWPLDAPFLIPGVSRSQCVTHQLRVIPELYLPVPGAPTLPLP